MNALERQYQETLYVLKVMSWGVFSLIKSCKLQWASFLFRFPRLCTNLLDLYANKLWCCCCCCHNSASPQSGKDDTSLPPWQSSFYKDKGFLLFILSERNNFFFFQANKPVVVTLGATLQQIQKLDAKEGTLTTLVWWVVLNEAVSLVSFSSLLGPLHWSSLFRHPGKREI